MPPCNVCKQQQGDETPMVWEMLLYMYPVLTRLALPQHHAHIPFSLCCRFRICSFCPSFWYWLQGALHYSLPSLYPTNV
ncbi:hypothetical protein HRI_005082800 [Hibiscus trionum]|uniref:Uncharacterized protein n=1 Tax=Hibiscus trionum TaxID=183268 RepID=A0A9W7JGK1_HIBTR|nr:hypothetical protein HRI_005082800 [Hibiscus trionum]